MIIADSREPKELLEMVGTLTPITVQMLEVGDYLWYDVDGCCIIVERKEIGDFLNSVVDGRLEDQATRLKAAADIPVMLREGMPFSINNKIHYVKQMKQWRDGVRMAPERATDFNTASLLGQQWALAYSAGLVMLTTSSMQETAMMLSIAYNSSQKEHHGSVYTGTRWLSSKASPQLACLATFPNLGIKKAQCVLNHFGTLAAVCEADIPQLMEVEGVGKQTATAIWEFVRGKKCRSVSI